MLLKSWIPHLSGLACLSGQKDLRQGPLGARGYRGNLQEEREGEEESLILALNFVLLILIPVKFYHICMYP